MFINKNISLCLKYIMGRFKMQTPPPIWIFWVQIYFFQGALFKIFEKNCPLPPKNFRGYTGVHTVFYNVILDNYL